MNKIIELYKKYKEIINYVIVGGLTTVASMAIFYGSTWTFLDGHDPFQLQVANVLSWVGAVLFSYIANRLFVFESKNPKIFKELIAFVSSRLVTLLLDMGTMFLLSSVLHINYNFAKIVAMVLVTVGNYVISKVFVFKKGKE
ncbi:MAG: GtrA family protein [Clostridia bacterium]|nr:GtrA family protein [Clostridia bacterium]MBR2953361.1 GtrA family protein [Clostridia bacterium]